MTHHGTPLKMMGLDQRRYPVGAAGWTSPGCCAGRDRWDYSVTAERLHHPDVGARLPGRLRDAGDRLPAQRPAGHRHRRARSRGPGASSASSPAERVVLYAPTHREHQPGYQPPLDPEALAGRARPGRGCCWCAATTSTTGDGGRRPERAAPRCVDVVARTPSVEDLYLAADVLVTDYSSAMFDYAVLDRPIVIYAPDWDGYRLTRGVYFDLMAEPPGAVATSDAELLDVFATGAEAGAARPPPGPRSGSGSAPRRRARGRAGRTAGVPGRVRSLTTARAARRRLHVGGGDIRPGAGPGCALGWRSSPASVPSLLLDRCSASDAITWSATRRRAA